MKKKIIISALITSLVVAIICLIAVKNQDMIETADAIYPASEANGWIGEKVIGNPDEAEVILYEYADFGCSHCADMNKTVSDLMEKYKDQIALVFRYYDIGQFPNSPAAARAVTAAQVQGYFKEYKDSLFANQTEWYYANKSELTDLFTEYFVKVSGDGGDSEKFQQDFNSDAVKARLSFERKLGKKVNLHGTPLFRINGEKIDPSELAGAIEKIIKAIH